MDEAAVRAARVVLEDGDVRHPRDINVEVLCTKRGVRIDYGPLTTADAWLLRRGKAGIIHIKDTARDTPRGRRSAAHELGHWELHADVDHFHKCTEEDRPSPRDLEYRVERQADHFATEFQMPEPFAVPLCNFIRPTIDDLADFASTFRTSLQASGIRFTQLTKAPCAFVVAREGVVKWAAESATFPGKIVKKRRLHGRTVSASLMGKRPRGDQPAREVPGEAWGAKEPLLEYAFSMGGFGVVSWISA